MFLLTSWVCLWGLFKSFFTCGSDFWNTPLHSLVCLTGLRNLSVWKNVFSPIWLHWPWHATSLCSYEVYMQLMYYVVEWLTTNTEWGSINNPAYWHCRCETEERNTCRLEQQVALLRESKRKADQSSMTLQAEFHHSMTELQEMHQEFEVTKCTANACYDIFFFGLVFSPNCLSVSFCLLLSIFLPVCLSSR